MKERKGLSLINAGLYVFSFVLLMCLMYSLDRAKMLLEKPSLIPRMFINKIKKVSPTNGLGTTLGKALQYRTRVRDQKCSHARCVSYLTLLLG